jgi:phage/plasmid-like protein (TIGR03299 family)
MAEIPVSRLFRRLDDPFASVDDALKAVHGDFTAVKEKAYIIKFGDDGKPDEWEQIPGCAAITKEEDWDPMSVMGDRYGIIQYRTALDFLDDMIGEREVQIYAATTVDNGAKLHLIVKTPDAIELSPGEKFECFYTVSASHDGSGCLQVMCSPIHSVAQTVFTPTGRGVIKIKHTAKAEARVALARRMLGKLHFHFVDFGEKIREMAVVKLDDMQARDYFFSVMPDKDGSNNNTRVENIRNKMYDLFKHTGLVSHLGSCHGTLFGCFMAVQQYADYYKTVRRSIRRSELDAKIEARLSGDGAKLKAEAYNGALLILQKFGR